MKIGCCTGIENYNELCELGYDFIELSGAAVMKMSEGELEEAVKLIDKNKVPCNGFNAYCTAELPMAGHRYNPEAARGYAVEICRRGKALGIRVIGLGAPPSRRIPKEFNRLVAAEQMKDFIRITCEAGEEQGIVLLLEALNPHVCDLVTHTREALEIVRDLDMPNLAMVLDFHHVTQSDEDVSEIDYVMPYVKHLHIDHTRKDGRYHLVEEGRDFYSLCVSSAKASGYDGTIAIEPTASKASFGEEARESLRILRSIV